MVLPLRSAPPYRSAVASCRQERLALAITGLLLSCMMATPRSARAQSPTDAPRDDETQAILVEAVREYDASNYEEAYALFLRVHETAPTARTERALGKTAFGLRRYREAAQWLALALEDQRSPLTAEMRTEVEGFLRRARAFLGRFTIVPTPPDASVDVDSQPIEGGVVELEIGEHEILARAAGHEPVRRRVSVRGGEDETLQIVLLPSVSEAPIVLTAADPGGTQRDLGWAGVIAGGLVVIGGVVATLLWSDSVASLNANIDRGLCAADASEMIVAGSAICYEQQNRYRLTLPLQYVGYGVGAALLGVGLALVVSAPSPESSSSASISCSASPLGASCRGSF